LAMLIAPRTLVVEAAPGPEVTGPPPARKGRAGAAPGRLGTPPRSAVVAEANRALAALRTLPGRWQCQVITADHAGSEQTLGALRKSLRANSSTSEGRAPTDSRTNFDPAPRQHRQFRQLTDFTQTLLPDAAAERQAYFW